jgi:hypothetical protein
MLAIGSSNVAEAQDDFYQVIQNDYRITEYLTAN